MTHKDSYEGASPLMEELDAICEGKSKLDLAVEIWKLRAEIERLRAGWVGADKIIRDMPSPATVESK